VYIRFGDKNYFGETIDTFKSEFSFPDSTNELPYKNGAESGYCYLLGYGFKLPLFKSEFCLYFSV